MNNKTFEIKAVEGNHIEFYASVFDVIDTHNDVTHPDTFKSTIERFNEGKHSVDLRLEHKSTFKTVGSITEMEVDDYGLLCKAVFHDTPIGRKVHKIAKEVFETKSSDILFSIGFVTLSDHKREDGVRSIDDVELGEVSIVESPSNKEAKVLEVKKTEVELLKDENKMLKAELDALKAKEAEGEPNKAEGEPNKAEDEPNKNRDILLNELNG